MTTQSTGLKSCLSAVKIANALMSLVIASVFGVLLLASLNCSAPLEPAPGTALLPEDSLAIASILKANKQPWPKTLVPGRNASGRATSLNLSFFGLDTIPPSIGDLTALTGLDLGNNRIHSLPQEVEALTELTYLNLGNNQLASLPDGFRIAHLYYIDLTRNRISALPTNVDVTGLTVLLLDSNLIHSLPPDFKYLQALTTLGLSGNLLDSLPSDINVLGALKRLNVSGNALQTLPPGLMDLQFDYLNVGSNRICFSDATHPDSSDGAMALWLDGVDRDWRATQKCK
ncbi:MAG: leucine-rich repeat-containing protein [Fibrobacteres bacterium]|nr:leucine-rich repeat-containing protein [Fibrobacterota bacterium]